MSLKNPYFTDGHAYVLALGYKLKISCDIGTGYKVMTGFKVEVTHIKINNTWKAYTSYINELVALTGVPFATIDQTYKKYMFGYYGFETIFYRSNNLDCYDLFDGAWHDIRQSNDTYKANWASYLDAALGQDSRNRTITDMVLTLEPQYAKFPTSESEFVDASDYYTTNSVYTGSKVCSATNVFGFVDLGVCPKSITYNGGMEPYYREVVAEYSQCFVHPIVNNFYKNCSLYSRITITNYDLYNNKSFILCVGRADVPYKTYGPGIIYNYDSCRAFCYKEIHSRDIVITDSNSTTSLSSNVTNYKLCYCADLQYIDNADNVGTGYFIRTNRHEYYTKRYLQNNSYSATIVTDNIEIIKKGKYKINFTFNLTTDYQDIADIFDIVLNVNGNRYNIPYRTSSTQLYLIIETNESLFVYSASCYATSKPTQTPHKYASGYLDSVNIETNNVLLPKESTNHFGFKINNLNQTIQLADTDADIAQCITAKQLAFRPDTSNPFILRTPGNNSIDFKIIVDTDVNAITSDTVFTIVTQHDVSSTACNTLSEAKQVLKQLDVLDYNVAILNKNITVHRFAFITTGSSYFAKLSDTFEVNIKQSEIDYLIAHLGVNANNHIVVI